MLDDCFSVNCPVLGQRPGHSSSWLRVPPRRFDKANSWTDWTSKIAAKDEYEAFFKDSTDNFRNGVTSGLMQRLNLWVNPKIATVDPLFLSLDEFTNFGYIPAIAEKLTIIRHRKIAALTWRVDSPVNRIKANELQQFTKGAIEEAVGLNWYNKPKEKSPFMPPAWLLIALLMSVVYAGQADSSYQAKKLQFQNQSMPNR